MNTATFTPPSFLPGPDAPASVPSAASLTVLATLGRTTYLRSWAPGTARFCRLCDPCVAGVDPTDNQAIECVTSVPPQPWEVQQTNWP